MKWKRISSDYKGFVTRRFETKKIKQTLNPNEDGDGILDIIDNDDDNDGIPDDQEDEDADGDGIIDALGMLWII